MQLDDVHRRIPPAAGIDVMAAYRDFCRESGTEDLDRFAAWLRGREVLSEAAYLDLYAAEPIEVTTVASLGGAAAETPTLAPAEPAPPAATTLAGGGPACPPAAPPTARGRYALLGLLGEGGMGRVLVAKDLDLRRKVALKQLKTGAAGPAGAARFLSEVQITAQLDHPNVVPVYSLEAGAAGALGYAMKLVQGKTLKTLIDEARSLHQRRVPLDAEHDLPTRLEHFLKICDSVAYAHSKGVVHRDLKPVNIMIGRFNEVYVMDWGIARLMQAPDAETEALIDLAPRSNGELHIEITQDGQIVGTPHYMSPEQAAGLHRELDGRSDQYTLGLILFELVTLTRARAGATPREVVARAQAGTLEPIEHGIPGVGVPRELAAIIRKAAASDRHDRYASVPALADDVRRYLRGEAVYARPDTAWQKILRRMARHREVTLATALFLLFASALAIAWSLYMKAAAEAAALRHEERIGQFLSAVETQGHEIDSHLLLYEAVTEGMAAMTAHALTHGTPSDEPLYFDADFARDGHAPPDLAPSRYYQSAVSLDWPAWQVAPGIARERVEPAMRRLAGLRFLFLRTLLESSPDVSTAMSPAAARSVVLEKGAPIARAQIGLASGVYCTYPGKSGLPAGYDPRTRPWYHLGRDQRNTAWGNPYSSNLGHGWVLPCSIAVLDEQDRFLGVASVYVTFDYVIEQLMSLRSGPAAVETFLLDDQGRLVIRSGQETKGGGAEEPALAEALPPFHRPQVVEAVRTRRTGYLAVGGEGRLVAWCRLASIGWTYVVEAEAARVLNGR